MIKSMYYDHSQFCNLFSADELGDFAAELKLSFFQLGISPQIIASIIMQVHQLVFRSLFKVPCHCDGFVHL